MKHQFSTLAKFTILGTDTPFNTRYTMQLSAIYTYPIKSLRGISLNQSVVEERGLQYDRRWMLVDRNGRFISQRERRRLALFKVMLKRDGLEVSYPGEAGKLRIPFDETAYQTKVKTQIWKDEVWAFQAPEAINRWFSRLLSSECSLVYMTGGSVRMADRRYAIENTTVSFADSYPFLVISEASLAMLNEKLEIALPMDRFRPNFVISGCQPHEEDEFGVLKIGELVFKGVKPCARCMIPTIDQQTAEAGKEPIRTLATYRKFGKKILFGENLCWDQHNADKANPIVRVGDIITLLQRKSNKSVENHQCSKYQAGDAVGGEKSEVYPG